MKTQLGICLGIGILVSSIAPLSAQSIVIPVDPPSQNKPAPEPSELQVAEREVEIARIEVDRYTALYREGAISQSLLQQKLMSYQQAIAKRNEMKIRYTTPSRSNNFQIKLQLAQQKYEWLQQLEKVGAVPRIDMLNAKKEYDQLLKQVNQQH